MEDGEAAEDDPANKATSQVDLQRSSVVMSLMTVSQIPRRRLQTFVMRRGFQRVTAVRAQPTGGRLGVAWSALELR